MVAGYTKGWVPDIQASALLMAVFIGDNLRGDAHPDPGDGAVGRSVLFPRLRGQAPDGRRRGQDRLDLPALRRRLRGPVAKLSGRGLGTTGGTRDKLGSISGLYVNLSEGRFWRQVQEVGLAIIGAGGLAPADKAIYALGDTTGTVDSPS